MNDDAHFEEVNRLLAGIEENETNLDWVMGQIDVLIDDIESFRLNELRGIALFSTLAFFAGFVIGGAL